MNLHQPVVKAHRDFIRRICLVIDPRPGVVQQLAQRNRNLIMGYPEIARTGPELAGPAPQVAEHIAVQILDKFFTQQIAAAAQRPILAAQDVFLLGLIQVAPKSNVGGDQTACFLQRERRRILRLFKEFIRGANPRPAANPRLAANPRTGR